MLEMSPFAIAALGMGVTITLAALGAAVAAIRAAWNLRGWLSEQFTATRKIFYDSMLAHEALDQKRHEDNLGRFSDIRTALASNGIMNGKDRSSDH